MILSVKTRERTELVDVTSQINQIVRKSGLDQGLCMVYVPHTTAGVTINESADPSVKSDMLMVLNQMVPWEAPTIDTWRAIPRPMSNPPWSVHRN